MPAAAPAMRAPAARLIVSDAELAALLELARGGAPNAEDLAGPTAAGWVVGELPAGVLADGLAALLAPVCELELQRGARRGHGAVDANCATLIVPGTEHGTHQLVVVTSAFLPDVLSRLNDLSPRTSVPPAVRLRYAAGDLTRILASRDADLAAELAGDEGAHAAAQLVSTLREHWRVEARWTPAGSSAGRRAVEVLDSDGGVWLVVPDGAAVDLLPCTPTTVFRQLIGLLPDRSEVALPTT